MSGETALTHSILGMDGLVSKKDIFCVHISNLFPLKINIGDLFFV